MGVSITSVKGREVIDSRGNPTVQAVVVLSDGSIGSTAVPSGASTGSLEAVELRDGDPSRYSGLGVLRAVEHIDTEIAECVLKRDPFEQSKIDSELIDLDGTPNKSRLGANAILGVSLAIARACACSARLPLYGYLARMFGGGAGECVLPVPQMNILNGGVHADNRVDFQEFMILPVGSTSIADAVRVGADVFHTLRIILKQNGLSTGVGDEGGFAPEVGSNEHAIEIVLEAITQAGYRPGLDVYLGLDVASSEFFRDGRYCLEGDGQTYTSEEFVQLIMNWIERYPILTIEDAMAEDDWEGWELITRVVGDRIQLTGDDLFVTNPKILKKGIDRKIANSVLIKVNQIGTLSETFEAICMAKAADYGVTISHRSGETEDTTIADLAVATGAGQIKAGSLCRSERVSKYNRLMMIEEELGSTASFAGLKGFPHYKKGGPTSKPPTSSG